MSTVRRPAADLAVGDVHIADNGKPRTVTGIVPDDDVVTITLDDGTTETVPLDLPLRIHRPRPSADGA